MQTRCDSIIGTESNSGLTPTDGITGGPITVIARAEAV